MRSLRIKQLLVWLFAATNIAIVFGVWWSQTGQQWLAGTISPFIAFGRLAGLLAVICALSQFVIMGRLGWLEPIFGMDKMARFHRWNGFVALTLVSTHAVFILVGYSIATNNTILQQLISFFTSFPYVWMAMISFLLFWMIVGVSLYIVRKHLKFETWYYVHIFVYLAIVLVPFHQLVVGGDFIANPLFGYYWIGLYTFVALNVLIWRFGRPLYHFWYHQFYVEKVIHEAPRATSVYISGRHMAEFAARAKAGQFVLVRFLTKDRWWQEHPFSLSMLPNEKDFRLTIRQLGDFTNEIPHLQIGTKVMVSGPHGAFTSDKAVTNKRLYIVGGIGITPVRSLIEQQSQNPSDAILLYGNRTQEEIIFVNELEALAQKMNMPIHHVLSEPKNGVKEKGFIDKEKIARLVPDVTQRDVYLCGPPPMMNAIKPMLRKLGVPKRQIHYERFALHVK